VSYIIDGFNFRDCGAVDADRKLLNKSIYCTRILKVLKQYKEYIFTNITEYKHVHVNLFCFCYTAFSLRVFERLHSFKHFPLVYVPYVHSLPLQRLNGSKKEIKQRTSFKILFIKN